MAIRKYDMVHIDAMEGHEFERFIADLLRKLSYQNVEVTRGSGDQGVDVLAEKDGVRYAIQCKCYSSDLGNTPVQEVNTGKVIYHCHVGVVVTNRYFTSGAKEAANATGVLLWDRSKLQGLIRQVELMEPDEDTLLKRGYIALEDGDWHRADDFFEQVLNQDAECAEAYFGKVLAEHHCANIEKFVKTWSDIEILEGSDLIACPEDTARIDAIVQKYQIPEYLSEDNIRQRFENFNRTYHSTTSDLQRITERIHAFFSQDRLMSRAMRYAKGDLLDKLTAMQHQIIVTVQKQLDAASAKDRSSVKYINERYAAFLDKTEQEVKELHIKAAQLKETEIRERQAQEFLAKQRAAQLRKNIIIASFIVVLVISVCGIATKVVIPDIRYKEAKGLLSTGGYDKAVMIFTNLGDYKDAQELKLQVQYAKAEAFLLNKEYENAIFAFEALSGYSDAEERAINVPYIQAEDMLAEGNLDGAIEAFQALGEYSDAEDRANKLIYQKAETFLANGDYENAVATLAILGNYSDATERISSLYYEAAEAYLLSGDSANAAMYFGKAGNYMDAKERSFTLWNQIAFRDTISAGFTHTLGIKGDNSVCSTKYTVENSYQNSLYHGECSVDTWKNIVAISAGASHSVGLKSDGTVVATKYTGDFYSNQCEVSNWIDIVAISTGSYNTFGLKSDGTVVATGSNVDDKCNISDWSNIISISAGSDHIVGLKLDGTAVAIGENDYRQCSVNEWKNITGIAAGGYHSVGLRSDETVIATGWNKEGQCNVSNWTDIIAISAGAWHTVGLKADGTVIATGQNRYGQCDVSSWTDIVAVSAGEAYTVGLKSNGTVVATQYTPYYDFDSYHGQCNVKDWFGIKAPK